MKKRNLLLLAALCAVSVTTSFSQKGIRANENNLGEECGCPPVSSRTTVVLMSSMVVNGTTNPELSQSVHLTCDKMYILDQKVYVPNGMSITIDPGTVIKGTPTVAGQEANASGLIIERGGKIYANGEAQCPVVMTAQADPMDGTYSITNVGKWGGLVLLGAASNNLVDGNTLCVNHTPGLGFVEGFTAANPWNHFGSGDAAFPVANDDDNSGVLKYLSVRHAGAILGAGNGNELNGITFGSVGRGTIVNHVEVVASADDNMEFFGGTVNVKYASTLFGDDDMFDYDLGYSGKVQFYLGVAADSLVTDNMRSTDNGFEADADDQTKATATSNHSNPIIYNVTMIGNGHIVPTKVNALYAGYPGTDNTGGAAIMAKELTGGQIYNSLFANFRSGLHLMNSRSAASGGDAYDQWVNDPSRTTHLTTQGGIAQFQALKVKHNIFVNCGVKSNRNGKQYPLSTGTMVSGKFPALYKDFTTPTDADTTQFFTTDDNMAVASLKGIETGMAFTNGLISNMFHVTPAANVTAPSAPNDGFFSPAPYRGAFDATKEGTWISNWANIEMQSLQDTNPTDLNGDGITDGKDLSILLGKMGIIDTN